MNCIQNSIQSLLNQLVEEGKELGVQVAAYIDGTLVVDAFAGVADPATGRPVEGETLFPIFSTGKGITATLLNLLVERGQITYETRIADCWPEYAAHGKAETTLRHALNHSAGLFNMPNGLTHAQLHDWDFMCTALADMKPAHPPGMELSYHAMTFGWIVGEVARRIDGRSFQRMLAEEICGPLGIGSMFIGIPDEAEPHVAFLEARSESAPAELSLDDPTPRTVPVIAEPLHTWMNRPDARRACIPASNGIMSARAIARHYAALLPGGVDGVELLPGERVRLAAQQQRPDNGRDEEPAMQIGLGYGVGSPTSSNGFGTSGHGGSTGFADPEHRLAFAFTRNRFGGMDPIPTILAALQKALGTCWG